MNKKVKILLLADALGLLAIQMFGPLYAIFVEQIGGDLLTAGWAYATFSICTGILVIITSRFEDKMKNKQIMVVLGYLLQVIGIVGYLFVKTPIHLFIVQIMLGIAMGLLLPAWDALYSQFLDKGRFATEWGLEEAQTYIVTAIASAMGGMIAAKFGFKTLFLIMIVFGTLSLLVSLKLMSKD